MGLRVIISNESIRTFKLLRNETKFYEINMNCKQIQLAEMSACKNSNMLPWETDWHIWGPIPNAGNTHSWPGEIGFSSLPLDGVTTIPENIEISGKEYSGFKTKSINGRIDFTSLFPPQEGCPIVYLMTELHISRKEQIGISFGADWGTQWWHNGKEIFNSKKGNLGKPDIVSSNQFLVELPAGNNLIVVKLIAGSPLSWEINLGLIRNYVTPNSVNKIISKSKRDIKSDFIHDYARTGLRLECRHVPLLSEQELKLGEKIVSRNGCEARWIGIIDHTGSPMAFSEFLPPGEFFDKKNESKLKEWVKTIHQNGMTAITWFPGVHSKSYAAKHPEYRAVTFNKIHNRKINDTFWESQYNLCPNTPYGKALIDFTLESIEKYNLDGFWFDGTSRSHLDLGCACEYCRKKFKDSTGHNFPDDIDWNDPVFRQWVKWRYDDFMEYWELLSKCVKKRFPNVNIIVNHLHRFGQPWYKGIPLGRYDADIIAATESQDDPFVSAFHARLQRAYQKNDSEVWMGLSKLFTKTACWPEELQPINRYKHHAMAVLTAGSHPSIGSGRPMRELSETCLELSQIINPRTGLNSINSISHLGLHLSQQAETFYFGRLPDGTFPDAYWSTIFGWHNIAMENQILTDIIFDEDITAETIKKYPVVATFNSVALSRKQIQVFEQYVNDGGVLFTDRYFGSRDEWGEPTGSKRSPQLIGNSALPAPDIDNDLIDYSPNVECRKLGRGRIYIFHGNPGLAFLGNHSRKLALELGSILKTSPVPPVISIVENSADIHLGAFIKQDTLFIHVQNFIAYSNAENFPNPVLLAPQEIHDIILEIRDMRIKSIEALIENSTENLKITQPSQKITRIHIPVIQWGEILQIKIEKG